MQLRTLAREKLREQIWGETFVDFEHSLNVAINKLRRTLNDSAETPRYIETVAGRELRRDAEGLHEVPISLLGARADPASAFRVPRDPNPAGTYESMAQTG